jgi:VanZ family protein
VYPTVEIVNADKLLHMGVYGLLAALCYISVIHQEKFSPVRESPFVFTMLIASFYGLSDELHQLFVTNRECEFWDWLADFAGALIMVLLIKYYLKKKYKLFQRKEIPSF